MRKSWDEYFMDIVSIVASRSTCLRRQVGAVLVKDRHIISTGYNGPPKHYPHCDSCKKDLAGIPSGQGHDVCVAVHAEMNSIALAAAHGISTAGATLYTQWIPCSLCARILSNAGIIEIVYTDDSYLDTWQSLEMFEAADVAVRKVMK
jgi:dCMP deaminase